MTLALRDDLLAQTAILTVSYNSSAQLEAFLSSAREVSRGLAQLIVVDNGSADVEVTRSVVSAYGANLLELGDNVGYGRAINAGWRAFAPDARFVVASNPDVLFGAGSLDVLATALAEPMPGSLAEIGAVGPSVLNEDGSTYPSGRAIPSLFTGAGHALFAKVWPTNPWTARYHSDFAVRTAPTVVGWLSGSCVMVSGAVFETLGGFDEGYFMYFEDVDLGYRIGLAGYTNVYLPDAEVTHVGGASTQAHSAAMVHAHHESAWRFLRRRYASPIYWPALGLVRLGLWARELLATRGKRPQRP
jgi:N-acetylglucosaminyl-diphospho-decaprenol L-rhamnosyltransferase